MWTAIVLIVIAGCALEAYRARYAGKADEETLAEIEAKIDKLDRDLRERVQTLERIVTDDKADLKRQFDYLDKAS
jgi:hypothetical protein